jgi:Protein of unknown function (DUF3623)
MSNLVLPSIYAILLWWFLTGAILYLNGLPRWTFKWSMAALSLLAAAALVGLAKTTAQTSVAAAYGAFTCAILLWGWQEAAFLFGYATGPRRLPCPPGAQGMARFRFALLALLYHELTLLLLGIAILAISRDAVNQLGAWTFAILWVMRMSAKLNIYLQSYFRRRPCNALFPFSIVFSTCVAGLIWANQFGAASGFEASALSLSGTLMTLAILEHWFMVVPFTVDGLWKWGLRSRESGL